MEIQFDGFTGYTANCIICSKILNLKTKSIPPAIRNKVRHYTAMSCESPSNVHINSTIIRNIANVAGQVRFNATVFGRE